MPTASKPHAARLSFSKRLKLEPLEQRRLLAVVHVNTAADVLDGDTSSIANLIGSPGADGKTSLREAIVAANNTTGADEVTFDPAVFTETAGVPDAPIVLGGAELEITDGLTVTGLGPERVEIDADGNSRVMKISGTTPTNISGLTLTGGQTAASGGGLLNVNSITSLTNVHIVGNLTFNNFGGGIRNTGSLTISRSIVSGNTSQAGGGGISGIGNSSSLTILDSTISGNHALSGGGGISNFRGTLAVDGSTISGNTAGTNGGGIDTLTYSLGVSTTATITNSTISGNIADGVGGGIFVLDGLTIVEHTTITLNTAAREGDGVWNNDNSSTQTDVRSSIISGNTDDDDVYSYGGANTFVSLGHNLIGGGNSTAAFNQTGDQTGVTNPLLGPLQNNGGPTETHALLAGSPALDAGNPSVVSPPVFDQRGAPFDRITNGVIDIGAYELRLLVDTATDESDGDFSPGDFSLREAVEFANSNPGPDTIFFDTTVFSATGGVPDAPINLTLGEIDVTDELTIQGLGIDRTRINGQNATRILDMGLSQDSFPVTLLGLHLDGGRVTADFVRGGAIRMLSDGGLQLTDSKITNSGTQGVFSSGGAVSANGDVKLTRSSLEGNFTLGPGSNGGAVHTGFGDVHLVDSTLSGNQTFGDDADGAGVYISHGQLYATNSTIHENVANGPNTDGGGAYLGRGDAILTSATITENVSHTGGGLAIAALDSFSSLILTSSIVAENLATSPEPNDIEFLGSGTFTAVQSLIGDNNGTGLTEAPVGSPDANGNLIGGSTNGLIDPLLGGLADNGGPTKTQALLPGSPAIDAGGSTPSTFDQRGSPFLRISGGTADMGAFESQIGTTIVGTTIIQAEEFDVRVDYTGPGNDHRFYIAPLGGALGETNGAGSFNGATGTDNEYIQGLTLPGEMDDTALSFAYTEYDIQVVDAVPHLVELNVAGVSQASNSHWVEIVGQTPDNTLGNTFNPSDPDQVQVNTNFTLNFQWTAAGVWDLPLGAHTIRVTNRETGAAVDALRVTPLGALTPFNIAGSGPTTIEAEDVHRRGAGLAAIETHQWYKVTGETAGAGSFVGAAGDYLQSLTTSTQTDSSWANAAAPAGTIAEFDVEVANAGVYDFDVRAAGNGFSSDSLWVEILGQTPVDTHDNSKIGDALRINLDAFRQFAWLPGGEWNLPVGVYTIRVSMRESGAAVDALRLEKLPAASLTISGTTTIEAEDFDRRNAGAAVSLAHDWWNVGSEASGVGSFTGGVGEYLQSLTVAGQTDSNTNNHFGPFGPFVEYDVKTTSAGLYNLDVTAAGFTTNSNSIWVEVIGLGASIASAQGLTSIAGALLVTTPVGSPFTTLDAGLWNLGVGDYRIRIYMRESGTAFDSLTIG